MTLFRGKGYYWATGAFFAGSFALQWATHGGTVGEFWNAVAENWQSEFLQLLWQVGGLAILYAKGSAQSKHESERLEDKVDHLICQLHAYAYDANAVHRSTGLGIGAIEVERINANHRPD